MMGLDQELLGGSPSSGAVAVVSSGVVLSGVVLSGGCSSSRGSHNSWTFMPGVILEPSLGLVPTNPSVSGSVLLGLMTRVTHRRPPHASTNLCLIESSTWPIGTPFCSMVGILSGAPSAFGLLPPPPDGSGAPGARLGCESELPPGAPGAP